MKLNVDDLVEQGLVKKKTYTEGRYAGLSVLKYTKKVFFKNLWRLDARLLHCRGTVIDENHNVIVNPFKKVFNLGENKKTVPKDIRVQAIVKVNGFMLCVTKTEKYGIIVSTTGTLDSDFVALGQKWVDTLNTDKLIENVTYSFEVCDESDQHIVPEEYGIYLIGAQWNTENNLVTEELLDKHAEFLGAMRPHHEWYDSIDDLDTYVEHEGFMIRNTYGVTLVKIKSPHYLVTKALLRMGKTRTNLMFNEPKKFKQQIDEEFYDLHEFVIDKYTPEDWNEFSENERRKIVTDYFEGK